MKYYIFVKNNTIYSVLSGLEVPAEAKEITKKKYDKFMEMQNPPDDTLETRYYLSAETETYVERETTHTEKVDWYVNKVLGEEMTIDEVPTEYKTEVEAKLPQPEQPTYTLDEAAALIASEVASDE